MRKWEDYKKTMIITPTLCSAAKAGENEEVTRFLDAGSDINQKDHRGYAPLLLAAYAGQLATVQLLIARGADVNTYDFGGNSVLMGASFKGDLAIVEALINAGANLSQKNNKGMDAYDFAQTFGRIHVADFLRLQSNNDHVAAPMNPVKRLMHLFKLMTGKVQSLYLSRVL